MRTPLQRRPTGSKAFNLVRFTAASHRRAFSSVRAKSANPPLDITKTFEKQQLCRARPSKAGQARFGGRRDPHPSYVATQRPACEDRGEMSLGLGAGVASWTLENKLGWGPSLSIAGRSFLPPTGRPSATLEREKAMLKKSVSSAAQPQERRSTTALLPPEGLLSCATFAAFHRTSQKHRDSTMPRTFPTRTSSHEHSRGEMRQLLIDGSPYEGEGKGEGNQIFVRRHCAGSLRVCCHAHGAPNTLPNMPVCRLHELFVLLFSFDGKAATVPSAPRYLAFLKQLKKDFELLYALQRLRPHTCEGLTPRVAGYLCPLGWFLSPSPPITSSTPNHPIRDYMHTRLLESGIQASASRDTC
ncbi:hypothetical protein EDB89DRAFT_1905733 [Lactarius sanguifluus]|nr:hypothetical protein EDB89DRAFT_1905733 [Lactarius sanguifluus]